MNYHPADVKWDLCTHIVYAFAITDPVTHRIRPADQWFDIYSGYYEKIVALRRKGIKVLISLKGLLDNFFGMPNPILTDFRTRWRFIESVVKFMHMYNFDGMELDLEVKFGLINKTIFMFFI